MAEYIPVAILVYFFGFVIVLKSLHSMVTGSELAEFGVLSIIMTSLINAVLASSAVAWLAMPKRSRLF